MYTATGPGSVRKVLRRRASLQLVMEVLSSDGEKILVKYHGVQYLTNPVFIHSSEYVIVISQQSIFNQSSIVITDRHRLQSPSKFLQRDFTVDLHRSKSLISLVPFNLQFHCFQGQGHCFVTIPIVFQLIKNNLSKRCGIARFPNIKLCFINDSDLILAPSKVEKMTY